MTWSRSIALSAGLMAVATLAGCHGDAAPTPLESANAGVADPAAGIVIAGARLVLPAVAGRPAAAYFTVRNTGSATATLTGIAVKGAGAAQMHRTQGGTMVQVLSLTIAPGETLAFAPGGLHAMVFDPGSDLKPGTDSALTLTFAGGDRVSAPLAVVTMGADSGSGSGAMQGMH